MPFGLEKGEGGFGGEKSAHSLKDQSDLGL